MCHFGEPPPPRLSRIIWMSPYLLYKMVVVVRRQVVIVLGLIVVRDEIKWNHECNGWLHQFQRSVVDVAKTPSFDDRVARLTKINRHHSGNLFFFLAIWSSLLVYLFVIALSTKRKCIVGNIEWEGHNWHNWQLANF